MLGQRAVESQVASTISGLVEESDLGPVEGLSSWVSGIGDLGAPLLLGMLTFSVVSGLLGYVLVTVGWRVSVAIRQRSRNRKVRQT